MAKTRRSKNKILKFPSSFLWGVSTSAYQTEGGVINDWSQWETSYKRMRRLKKKGLDHREYVCGRACDSYNLYKEDIDKVKSLGCNVYRFGIEWSRLEPIEGEFNQEEFDHYKEVLSYAKKRGLKIILTVWHWTNPLWFSIQGGWAGKRAVNYFDRFVQKAAKEFAKDVDYWCVINEPLIHVGNGYLKGKFPPCKKNPLKAYKVFNNLAKAYRKAYRTIHKQKKNARVGFSKLATYFEPARPWCPIERFLAWISHYFYNMLFLEKVEKEMDYIGIDYYFHNRMIWHPPFVKNKNKKTSDMGWEIYPEGLGKIVEKLSVFNKPIMIIENGVADSEDQLRDDFIKDHLESLRKAIKKGAPVIGYCHWSLMDNFEWAEGWTQKFGLFEVDRETFERKPRPSAKLYSKICKNNGL